MAYSPLNNTEIEVGKAVKQELFTKIKDSFTDHETRISTLETSSIKIEVFNFDFLIGSFGSTVTGLMHHECLQNMNLVECAIQIFNKGSVTGTLSVDIKKNTTPDNVGMTSIFLSQPTINVTAAADYARSTGTFDTLSQTITKGDILRVDITSLPVGLGKFRLVLIGEV